MSSDTSKNKGKRSRSSSEANNSFVKNVTSRVSGLLPTTITKWFSSPSSSNANGSTPTADSTDSSTEDEAPENTVIIQPPAKRMRYSSPKGKFNHFNPSENNTATTSIDEPEPCSPYSTVQSPPGRNTFRRETNFVSTPLRSTNKEIKIERSERDSTMSKSQPSIAATGQSISSKRKSIFDTTSKEASIRASAKISNNMVKPYFKPTLLGSPFYPGRTAYGGAAISYMNEPNIKERKATYVNEANRSNISSMSNSTRRIMDLIEEYSSPLAEAKRIQQFLENSSNNILPHTAKSASYKTRELLVPSVASIFRLKQKSRLMDTTNAARQIIASHSSAFTPTQTKKPSDEKQESEYVSTQAVNKMKTHLTRTNRGRDLEEPSVPLNLPNAVLNIDQSKLPKITFDFATTSTPLSVSKNTFSKSKLSQATATITKSTDTLKAETASSDESFRFTSPVRISSDLTTNCITTPRYTFGSPERSIDKPKVDGKKEDSSSKTEITANTDKVTNSKDWQCNDCWVNNKSDSDKCACCGGKKPVMLVMSDKCSVCKLTHSQPTIDKCKSCEGSQKGDVNKLSTVKSSDMSIWKCKECWVGNTISDVKCVCCGAENPNKSSADAPKLATEATEAPKKDWKCEDCWVTNLMSNEKCACCGAKKPNNSVADAPRLATMVTEKDWKCEECWVSNPIGDAKCICCGAKNPKKSSAKVPKPATNEFEKEWKCKDCWAYNHSCLAECMDCGAAKHKSKESSSTVVSNNNFQTNTSFAVDKSFNKIVKAQTDMWECSICLVRNESNKSKCVCCETDKGGAKQSSENKYNFNFGVNTNNSFKFGVKQDTSSIKKIDTDSNQESQPKIEESETNNNVIEKSPSFTFTSPTKKNTNQVDTTKETTTSSALKINFTFGIPKQLPNEKSLDSSKNVKENKTQEVPKIDFGTLTKDNPKPLGNMFNSPLVSNGSTKSSPLLSAAINNENKETASKPLLQPSVAITTTTQAPSTFSFESSGIKVTQNLFMAPSSTTTAPSVSFMLSQQSSPVKSALASAPPLKSLFENPDIATTSAIPVFQRSSPINASSVSLFQKSDTCSSAAPPTATAPIFSFGNSISSTAPAPVPANTEKPKFNFLFGNANKTESSSMFKPATFGIDTAGAPNKFTITSGDGINASNAVSGNSLGGSVGLSTGNSLITSGPLGSNNLSTGNTLRASNDLPTDTLTGGSGLQPGNALPSSAPGLIFGGSIQKENLWSSNNNASTNVFASNSTTATSSLQKPSAFTFGSSMPFNANNTATPTFGSNTPASPVVFGMSNQNNNNNSVSMFSTASRNQTPPSNIFGAAQPQSNAVPTMGMFGTANVGTAPAYHTANQSISSFEAPSLTPSPAPTFSFGSPQTGVFGFGQHQQQAQQQPSLQPQQQQQQQPGPQAGVYSFGGAPVGSPHVQFNMGSAPNTTMRRVRKAVRRNPQR